MSKNKNIFIIGLFAITIGIIGGYYYFTPSTIDPTIPENVVDMSYSQWVHSTNTARASFDFWESDPSVVLLYDRESSLSISATLTFSDIAIGKIKLQMRTLSTEYNGQMYIDFKKGNSVVFSIIRDSSGGYTFKVNRSLSNLGIHDLEITNFYIEWNFDTRLVKISAERQENFRYTVNLYTVIESIDNIKIYTTYSTFNSGTLFFFENSYLTWTE
ncbi:hypothetical protein LCGC14_1735730 [marine sediment metagenome]|uniref:Uncharacterized protein n=1 Tax=marine sediment metagenome TaxID=412755 RepID=A0A0F9H848_9ZZZZ